MRDSRRAAEGHYLDTATYGLPSEETIAVLHEALRGWQTGTARWVDAWDSSGERARAHFATIVGRPESQIALAPSAAAGVAHVAWSLSAGSRVLGIDADFTSLLYPFLERERVRRDITVSLVPAVDLVASVDDSYALVAASHVQSATGYTLDTDALMTVAHHANAAVLIDGTQSVGSMSATTAWRTCDFLVASAYKWLCCPRGVAFFGVREDRVSSIASIAGNWRGGENPYGAFYGPELRLATTARRFDTPLAWHAWHGAATALAELVEPGMQQRLEASAALMKQLCAGLGVPYTGSQIVALSLADPDAAVEQLSRAGITAARRADGLRLSLHHYNDESDVAAVLGALRSGVPD